MFPPTKAKGPLFLSLFGWSGAWRACYRYVHCHFTAGIMHQPHLFRDGKVLMLEIPQRPALHTPFAAHDARNHGSEPPKTFQTPEVRLVCCTRCVRGHTHLTSNASCQVTELRNAVERERAALEQLEGMIESERKLLGFSASSRSASQSPICAWREFEASSQSTKQAGASKESLVATLFVEETEELIEKRRRAAEKRAAFLAATAGSAAAVMTPGRHDGNDTSLFHAPLSSPSDVLQSAGPCSHGRSASRSPPSRLAGEGAKFSNSGLSNSGRRACLL